MRFRQLEVEHNGEKFTVRELGALPRVKLFKDIGEDTDKAILASCAALALCVYQGDEPAFKDAEDAGNIPQALFDKLTKAWGQVNGMGDIDPNA